MKKNFFKILFIGGLMSTAIIACTTATQQGNYIATQQLNQVQIGMNQEQVAYILGYPLVNEIDKPNHWNYITYQEKTKETKKVIVIFNKHGNVIEIKK